MTFAPARLADLFVLAPIKGLGGRMAPSGVIRSQERFDPPQFQRPGSSPSQPLGQFFRRKLARHLGHRLPHSWQLLAELVILMPSMDRGETDSAQA